MARYQAVAERNEDTDLIEYLVLDTVGPILVFVVCEDMEEAEFAADILNEEDD